MKRNEFIGRCFLWHQAVSETKSCLEISIRAKKATKQKFQKDEQGKYQDELKEFVKSRKDYQNDTLTSTQLNDFKKIYERPFPYMGECYSISNISLELAIVNFSRIFNVGYGDENAASNKEFLENHKSKLINKVFDNGEKKAEFEGLLEKIILVRDKMIGHADAEAFSIKHGTPVSTMGGTQNITKDIDLEYWLSFMECFRISILEYMKEHKNDFEE